MARVRSPNYPTLSLPEAIKSVTAIQAAEQHLAAPKEVAAKHLGYTSYHGLAGRVISAIEKYGLLEDVSGDKVKVSSLAMSILFPSSPAEKQKAINEAAFKPTLFAAIKEEWGGAQPSDENLRVYLIRRKFGSDALDRVIQVYRETMALVTPESGEYIAGVSGNILPAKDAPPMQQTALHGSTGNKPPPPPSATVPMRIAFDGDQLEVSAILTDAEAVDRLIRALTANKSLLPAKPKVDGESAN